MQVTRIGWVALHAERLSPSGRRSLPRHPILQIRLVGVAARRSDLEGHFHEPVPDGRKGEFFGMNNSRDAGEPLTGGRCRRGRTQACQSRARQQCRGRDGELHDVFRLGFIPVTRPMTILSTRLLAPHNKIKVHVRAIRIGRVIAGCVAVRLLMRSTKSRRKISAGSFRDQKGDCRKAAYCAAWLRWTSQLRLRFFRTKEIKTAISPTAMSIQYWPSNPRTEKCPTRNCNVPAPPTFLSRISVLFGQDKQFWHLNPIIFILLEGRPALGAVVVEGPKPRRQSAAISSRRAWRR